MPHILLSSWHQTMIYKLAEKSNSLETWATARQSFLHAWNFSNLKIYRRARMKQFDESWRDFEREHEQPRGWSSGWRSIISADSVIRLRAGHIERQFFFLASNLNNNSTRREECGDKGESACECARSCVSVREVHKATMGYRWDHEVTAECLSRGQSAVNTVTVRLATTSRWMVTSSMILNTPRPLRLTSVPTNKECYVWDWDCVHFQSH